MLKTGILIVFIAFFSVTIASAGTGQRGVLSGVGVSMVQSGPEGADQILFQFSGTSTGEDCSGVTNNRLYIKRSTVGNDRFKELLAILISAMHSGAKIAVESNAENSGACSDVNSVAMYY